MARIKLALPELFPFSTELDVRISDINYGQHLGNDAMLSLLHEARLRFLAQWGYSEIDAAGCGMIMTDAAVVFKREVVYGERLRIEVAAADPSRSGCDIYYRVSTAEDGRLVAEAKTGIVFFDYTLKKMVKMPPEFREQVFGE